MKIEAVPFARKVLDYARADFKRRRVADYDYDSDDYEFDMSTFWWTQTVQDHCHTRACLAGTAVLLDPEVELKLSMEVGLSDATFGSHVPCLESRYVDVQERARQLLGLSSDEAYALFFRLVYFDDPPRTPEEEALDLLESWIIEAEARNEGQC